VVFQQGLEQAAPQVGAVTFARKSAFVSASDTDEYTEKVGDGLHGDVK
jgi:hypothetical protein